MGPKQSTETRQNTETKERSWMNLMYQKFEYICDEINNPSSLFQETTKYVEKQMNVVGANAQKLCTELLQDLLPLAIDEPVKASDSSVQHRGELAEYKKVEGAIDEISLKTINSGKQIWGSLTLEGVEAKQISVETTTTSTKSDGNAKKILLETLQGRIKDIPSALAYEKAMKSLLASVHENEWKTVEKELQDKVEGLPQEALQESFDEYVKSETRDLAATNSTRSDGVAKEFPLETLQGRIEDLPFALAHEKTMESILASVNENGWKTIDKELQDKVSGLPQEALQESFDEYVESETRDLAGTNSTTSDGGSKEFPLETLQGRIEDLPFALAHEKTMESILASVNENGWKTIDKELQDKFEGLLQEASHGAFDEYAESERRDPAASMIEDNFVHVHRSYGRSTFLGNQQDQIKERAGIVKDSKEKRDPSIMKSHYFERSSKFSKSNAFDRDSDQEEPDQSAKWWISEEEMKLSDCSVDSSSPLETSTSFTVLDRIDASPETWKKSDENDSDWEIV